jgi:hypothetical protein
MEDNLLDLPDGMILSLMFGSRRFVSKEIQNAAASEWTRRVNERNLQAALERQKEIMNNERMD